MRKIILLLLLSCSLSCAYAGGAERHEVYCEVVYFVNALSKKTVNIYYDDEKYDIVQDGTSIKLKSVTQAMRLLSEKGWKLRTSFGISGGNGVIPAEYHYIMVKEVSSDEDILEGLKQR